MPPTLKDYLENESSLHYPHVQRMVALCYRQGRGTLQNLEASIQWLRKAVDQDDPLAMSYLGDACFEGRGVPKDYDAAYSYYTRALALGHTPKRLALFDAQGRVQLQSDFSQYPGLPEAARRGSVSAFTAMGNCYFLGHGTQTDYETAVSWYRKAAQKGDPEAICALGYAYAAGAGVQRDCEEALRLFRQATRQDFLPAWHNMEMCYRFGCGTAQDLYIADVCQKKTAHSDVVGKHQRFFTPVDYDIASRRGYLTEMLKQLNQPTDLSKGESL